MALRFGEQGGGFSSGLLFGSQSNFTSEADVTGSGVLQAQAAAAAGAGFRTAVDIGTLPDFLSGEAAVVGVGEVIHTATGTLQAQSAQVVGTGAGLGVRIGTGAVQAQQAAAAGVGIKGIGGSGALLAQQAVVVGLGGLENQHFGTGVLFAQSATISGAGEREIKGAGTLQGGVASAFGSGVVYEIAVNYVCYLPPNTLALEKLSLTSSYALQFSNPKNVPNSVTVGWDDLVTYHAGNPEPTVDAYKFSGDKTFVEDQDDEY